MAKASRPAFTRTGVSRFLSFHGYLPKGGDVDQALRDYQEAHGAPCTGNLNYQTKRLLSAYRCPLPERGGILKAGVPTLMVASLFPMLTADADLVRPEIHVDTVNPRDDYQRVHARWSDSSLGYSLVGNTPSSIGVEGWKAVRSAFATWTGAGPIRFSEVTNSHRSEVRVLWTPGRAEDPHSRTPFYGAGGRVALGHYPFPFLHELAGDVHFDTGEQWTLDGTGKALDVETVALHEIGHSLGLGHSRNPDSILYPIYKARQRLLSTADKAEIYRRYQGIA